VVIAAWIAVPIGAAVARAQDAPAPPVAGLAPVRFTPRAVVPETLTPTPPTRDRDKPATKPRDGGSWLLGTLYMSTAVVHALDAHSTLTAFKYGAIETNPLMQWAHERPDVFLAVKAAVAASTILAARALARRHRTTAIVVLSVINGAYAAIVHHNYDVGRRLK
jgi:hypothetical protein